MDRTRWRRWRQAVPVSTSVGAYGQRSQITAHLLKPAIVIPVLITPQKAAVAILDGVEDGQTEVLVDDYTRMAKAALSGPVEGLQIR